MEMKRSAQKGFERHHAKDPMCTENSSHYP